MKYYKTLGLFKCSNLTYNPKTGQGYSFDWYRIVDKIDGQYILNTYNYSNSTIKHVSKIREILSECGVREYFEIEAPQGLQNLEQSVHYYDYLIKKLNKELENKRIRKPENRINLIKFYKQKIVMIKILLGREV